MADRTPAVAPATGRATWPYQGAPQVLLLIAALVTIGASFLPWLPTPFFDAGGQAGLVTFYAGVVALPGTIWRRASVVQVHALLLAVAALGLPLYRLAWAARRLPAFGSAWFVGAGLVLVLVSGGVALYAAVRLGRRPPFLAG